MEITDKQVKKLVKTVHNASIKCCAVFCYNHSSGSQFQPYHTLKVFQSTILPFLEEHNFISSCFLVVCMNCLLKESFGHCGST
uniref:Uncharacterized protein n=1 Tax=Rhizophora mucronata TaxID=61149 RepID=A0A2P2QNK6_RHIMU